MYSDKTFYNIPTIQITRENITTDYSDESERIAEHVTNNCGWTNPLILENCFMDGSFLYSFKIAPFNKYHILYYVLLDGFLIGFIALLS